MYRWGTAGKGGQRGRHWGLASSLGMVSSHPAAPRTLQCPCVPSGQGGDAAAAPAAPLLAHEPRGARRRGKQNSRAPRGPSSQSKAVAGRWNPRPIPEAGTRPGAFLASGEMRWRARAARRVRTTCGIQTRHPRTRRRRRCAGATARSKIKTAELPGDSRRRPPPALRSEQALIPSALPGTAAWHSCLLPSVCRTRAGHGTQRTAQENRGSSRQTVPGTADPQQELHSFCH